MCQRSREPHAAVASASGREYIAGENNPQDARNAERMGNIGIALLEAAYRSAAEGRAVELPDGTLA